MEERAAGHLLGQEHMDIQNALRNVSNKSDGSVLRDPGREVVLVNGADFSLGYSADMRIFRKVICNMPWQTGGLYFVNLILVETYIIYIYICFSHRSEAFCDWMMGLLF